MQRKQQVGECWVYVIFFALSLSPSSTSFTRDAPASGAPEGGHRGVLVSGFAIHGIGFFGPWFSNSGIGIRVSEVG